jgi:perosamine synthetase
MITTMLEPQTILSVLKNCLDKSDNTISLHEPCFRGNEWLFVKDCIDSGWVSSVGKYVDRFEDELARFTGAKRAVAVANGTVALQVALELAGVRAGDEVLVPSLTFIATANAISHAGAVPHFVDADEKSLGVDPEKLQEWLRHIVRIDGKTNVNKITGRRIGALIVVHTFGHPVDLDSIAKVCEKYNLVLIEDAAESIGSYYKGVHTGNHGLLSTLSFNGNKTITTGGGGAILTNDLELGRHAKHLTTTAKIPHRWKFSHDEVGYNFRLPNINAALGCAQMELLPAFIEQKRNLAKKYEIAFRETRGLEFFVEPAYAKSNYWLNSLILDSGSSELRDEILQLTNDHGIQTRPAWEPLHTLPMYSACQRMDLSITTSLASRIINIPSSPCLSKEL